MNEFTFLEWSCQDVAKWIESLGFSQYKECFTENFISGRKLILVNCSNLPKFGITDFNHMKVICARVRELLGITETPWTRSVADPPRDVRAMYLEHKRPTGARADGLTYREFSDGLRRGEEEALM
ncbi:sterile alpha motif domain-containing protein 15-like [Periophthalmus magnuspinnatus]|uniref:sterile alpha motif domain-containing protein 15-like n=1 Tax=Periophthalmus magnuspinnatus TaxID=409849 RepID=UPI0024374179|nr:sterile alpha motif domain-containing protein 15-like [Periophthalmus magnuspinnatus]